MRGNLTEGRVPLIRVGSIPACAGEPSSLGAGLESSAVYPRVCGGTYSGHSKLTPGTGLSPRVRGNLNAEPEPEQAHRSIPACAGEPLRTSDWLSPGGVYPRVCGGTSGGCSSGMVRYGLSPRVRGNLIERNASLDFDRSIPACAGEPPSTQEPQPTRRVYPRVCGGTNRQPVHGVVR